MRSIWTAFLAVLALISAIDCTFAQSPKHLTIKTAIHATGLVGDLYLPADAQGQLPAVIVIGGSGGGMDARTAWEARTLAEHGYAALQLAYILAPGLPTAIYEIRLEYFKAAIDWLRTQPKVDSDRIGFMGTSIGGMAALLVAAHYPELKVVVAAVPSSVVWSTFGSSRASMFSMFSLGGRPLPFLPYGLNSGNRVHDLYDDGLNTLAEHEDAIIPVERINGPVMVICGKNDSLWPSCRMSGQVIARLDANKFRHAMQILEYPDAGHFVFGPPLAPKTAAFNSLGSQGGSPAGNNAARIDSWPRAVAFIDAALKKP